MPAIGTLVINDGKTTPVAHTFTPTKISDMNVAAYADRSGGVPIGYWTASIGLREPAKNGQGVYKVTAKLMLPVLEVTSGSTGSGFQAAPTVAYVMAGHVEFLLPSRSTLADRKDVLAITKNFLANAVFNSVVENLEGVY